jgi:DNA replicative helicase MCM subunit Mcm2 (Cdc46/Mcm family)
LTDDLADGFRPGQRVTITAVLIDGEFITQKIELAPR